jgi:SAM-dependent methyltransferase
MKDIVENRRRISLGAKLRIARIALAENGLFWCLLFGTYYLASTVGNRAFAAMDALRRKRDIPGLNSRRLNKEIWEAWEWSGGGDEWTHSQEWKQSLIRCVLEKHVPAEATVIEIGPGAGRWTVPLLERARSYLGIDVSATCIAHCRKRFADAANARFELGSGEDLAAAKDAAADAIWSFDVFVHINRAEIERYAAEFARVLKPGGVAVIHHGGIGGSAGGWRSNLTAADFTDIADRHRLQIETSFTGWTDGNAAHELSYGDRISVMRKPSASGS